MLVPILSLSLLLPLLFSLFLFLSLYLSSPSSGPCQAERSGGSCEDEDCKTAWSLFVEVTQRRGRANEPSSSFFLPLPSPPFPPSPSIAIRRPPLIPHCAFALPLILFVLSAGTEEAVGPSRSASLSDHAVAFPFLFQCPSRPLHFALFAFLLSFL